MKKTIHLPKLKNIKGQKTKRSHLQQQHKTLLSSFVTKIPLGASPIEELGIQIADQEDYKQLKFLLQDLLQYPTVDFAQLHRDSNRLGFFDILDNDRKISQMLLENNQPQICCHCCGYILQTSQITFKTSLNNICNIGVSTLLYFRSLIALCTLLGILFIFYGIYALATNFLSFYSYPNKNAFENQMTVLSLSLSYKRLNLNQENSYYYLIQCWLGLVVIVIWFFAFFVIKYFEKNDSILLNNKTISAADFSVVLQGVPTSISSEELKRQLARYYQNLTLFDKIAQIDRPFILAKVNKAVPFYLTMEELENQEQKGWIKQKQKLRQQFVTWVSLRREKKEFTASKAQRITAYKRYQQLEDKIQQQYKKNVEEYIEQTKKKHEKEPTTSMFVTFESSFAKQLICSINQDEFSVCRSSSRFKIMYQNNQYLVEVKSAPEPQDIIWTNIGQSLCQTILRKLLTYAITSGILVASFFIQYQLSLEQIKNSNNSFLSFLISLSIVIINIIIQGILVFLTQFERQSTQTNYQSGVALKSTLAQVINSIIIPFIVKYRLEKNIYGVDGLSYVIFTLSIVNSFITPLLKLINFEYIIYKIKCLVYQSPEKRLSMNQEQLNNIYTQMIFQTGAQYIYAVNLFLFVCFYVSLQPIICLFAASGLGLMYIIQKWTLLTRSRRPYPGNSLVNGVMYRVLYFSPLIFTLGNFTWSSFLQNGGPKQALVPNLISIGLSVIFLAVPMKSIFSRLIPENYSKQLFFSQCRIYLSSEFDRMNPATTKAAMKQYQEFLLQYKKDSKNAPKQFLDMVEQTLLVKKQNGPTKKMNKLQQRLVQFSRTLHSRKQAGQLEQEEDSDSQLSAIQNHMIIKEDSIQYLSVEKKKKKASNDDPLKFFQHFIFNDNHREVNFIQNWESDKNTLNKDDSNLTENIKIQKKEKQMKEQLQVSNNEKKKFDYDSLFKALSNHVANSIKNEGSHAEIQPQNLAEQSIHQIDNSRKANKFFEELLKGEKIN